jgi:hypothetical protein
MFRATSSRQLSLSKESASPLYGGVQNFRSLASGGADWRNKQAIRAIF